MEQVQQERRGVKGDLPWGEVKKLLRRLGACSGGLSFYGDLDAATPGYKVWVSACQGDLDWVEDNLEGDLARPELEAYSNVMMQHREVRDMAIAAICDLLAAANRGLPPDLSADDRDCRIAGLYREYLLACDATWGAYVEAEGVSERQYNKKRRTRRYYLRVLNALKARLKVS
jgi:hypothetical protein